VLTLNEVEERTRKTGMPVAERTLWKYIKMGLLPAGEKLAGHGNVLYFPDETPDRITQLHWLNKEVGIPLPVLQRSLFYLREGEHWESIAMKKPPSPLDLIVSWAGVMANMHIVHKPELDRGDLTALFEHLKKMFEKLGVREPSTSSPLQGGQHVDTPQIQGEKE